MMMTMKTNMSINVGELTSMGADGKEIWVTEDVDKAEMFAQFYTKIFTVESDDGPMIEMQSEAVCEEIVVSLDMVLKKLEKINPNKSPGPDRAYILGSYTRLKRLQHILQHCFLTSLSAQVNCHWKYSIISTIHKKRF